MLALLFILLVTGLSILISYYSSEEVTWFTYFAGSVAGLFVSGIILEIYNKRRRKKEEEEERNRP